jgi:hypothetical protein
MSWKDANTLDDLNRLNPIHGGALTNRSLDFFLPACTDAHWEVERKPLDPGVLVLRPNQPVSRAWDMLFRCVIARLAPIDWGSTPYAISPQVGPSDEGPRFPEIELPATDRSETERIVGAINAATRVTNSVVADAFAACRREHEELARDLGLDRPRVDLPRAA